MRSASSEATSVTRPFCANDLLRRVLRKNGQDREEEKVKQGFLPQLGSVGEVWSADYISTILLPRKGTGLAYCHQLLIGSWLLPGGRCGQRELLGTCDILHMQAKLLH